MRWGELVHAWILEPDKIGTEYIVMQEGMDKRTKKGKLWIENELERNPFVKFVTYEENAELNEIVASVNENQLFQSLMMQSEYIEPSVYWTDETTGVKCRARPDIVGHDWIMDVKTTSATDFASESARFRYHVQAAFYLDAMQKKTFYFCTIQNDWPFFTQILEADEIFLARGREEYKTDLASYKMCMESGEWPGPAEYNKLTLPNWYK